MSEDSTLLSALPPEARTSLQDFSQDLQESLGDDLVAVILYTSSALSDYALGRPDYNILVVLEGTGASSLKQMATVVRGAWQKRSIGSHPSRVEEVDDISYPPTSLFKERENYTVLHGRDVLANLPTSHESLMSHSGSQLRIILLRMHDIV